MLGMMEVQQGQEFLRNYIFKNRKEKMDGFVSVAQFSDFQFLLQQMFHIQDQPVQKSISDRVYFSKVTSLHWTECNSTIYRFCHIYFWSMFQKLVWRSKTLATSYGFKSTSYEFKSTSKKIKSTSCRVKSTSQEIKSTSQEKKSMS